GVDRWQKARSDVAVILLSREQLSSPEFRRLIKDKTSACRLMEINADVFCSWGGRFRTSFTRIGHICAHFSWSPAVIALTATLCAGAQMEAICKYLG
ncbi:hypothetical protein C8Q72DRAFT_764375, partial [Fomitopsis betulina]